MSFALIAAVKNIQLACQIIGAYNSKIDGIWGDGSRKAANILFGSVLDSEDIEQIPAWSTADTVIRIFQKNVKKAGIYHSHIDGIWGNGSQTALEIMTDRVREQSDMPALDLSFSASVPPEFTQMVKDWTVRKGYPARVADYVMSIMAFESGRTFDPSIQNAAGSNAFGLLQFMAPAAKDLGFTLDQIRHMGQLEQLEKAVLPYFDMRQRQRPMKNLEDFYLSVLYPAYVGRKLDEVLFEDGSVGYRQNRGLDRNGDGFIQVGEIAETIYKVYYEGMQPKKRRML